MYERLSECPVCKATQIGNRSIIKDYSISQESFAVCQCKNCGALFTNPRPALQDIGKYYESQDYVSHTGKGNNLTNRLFNIARWFTLRKKQRQIRSVAKEQSLLDYGCGTGAFINHCAKARWQVTGIEPSENARSLAKQTGQTVYANLDALPADQKFGIITLWHVLEHVHDLDDVITTLRNHLAPNGKLFIAVPNPNSYDARLYGDHWAAWDVPRHLYHFTQKDIKTLLKRHKLKLHKLLPMKLDAFYVSLLSEQYKNGRKNFVRAFMNGLKSNAWAKANNTEYSSLIYVIRK